MNMKLWILASLLLSCIASTAFAESWQEVKIENFHLKGGKISDWVQTILDEAEKAGAVEKGFGGIEYLYPLKDRDVGPAEMDVKEIPVFAAFELLGDAFRMECRTKDQKILIQPDRTYEAVSFDITENLLRGIGLNPESPLTKQTLSEAFKKLGVQIDTSPDDILLEKIESRTTARISVIKIDEELLRSIIHVAKSGLFVSPNQESSGGEPD